MYVFLYVDRRADDEVEAARETECWPTRRSRSRWRIAEVPMRDEARRQDEDEKYNGVAILLWFLLVELSLQMKLALVARFNATRGAQTERDADKEENFAQL